MMEEMKQLMEDKTKKDMEQFNQLNERINTITQEQTSINKELMNKESKTIKEGYTVR